MKEVGPLKSVIFILILPWDQGRKTYFPLKCSEEASQARKGNRDSLCVLRMKSELL